MEEEEKEQIKKAGNRCPKDRQKPFISEVVQIEWRWVRYR